MEQMNGIGTLPNGFEIYSPHAGTLCYFFEPFQLKPGKPKFSLTGEVGTLFFFMCGEEPMDKENQVDVFPEGILIRIDLKQLPEHIAAHPQVQERGKEISRLCFQHPISGAWVPFQRQMVDGDYLEITFNFWFKDPGIGWGFI